MHDHNLVESFPGRWVLVEQRAVKDRSGALAEGLHNVWITLNNPSELNSYTTDMVKEVILALRAASNDRGAVAVVITGAGSRAFCTGGNTREYAEVYAGNLGDFGANLFFGFLPGRSFQRDGWIFGARDESAFRLGLDLEREIEVGFGDAHGAFYFIPFG